MQALAQQPWVHRPEPGSWWLGANYLIAIMLKRFCKVKMKMYEDLDFMGWL